MRATQEGGPLVFSAVLRTAIQVRSASLSVRRTDDVA
jgi:hypothetical protein